MFQECICRAWFLNRRANIIQLSRLSRGVTSTVHRCDNLVCRNYITSTVNVCCESAIWLFVNFSAVFFSVYHWNLSVVYNTLVIDLDVISMTFSRISVSVCYGDRVIRRFNSCNVIFQLFNVYSICIVFTSFNACNCFITSIDAIFLNRWTTSDSQTIVVNCSITNFYGTIFSKIYIFSQLNFQFAVNIVYTDVFVSQFSFISATNDINYLVKMFLNNLWVSILVSLTVVTSELHAIIVSCYFMFVTVFVLVYDTSHSFTRLAVNAWNTIFYSDVSSCIFTIFTSRASQTNVTYAIFTGDRYCVFTVFTRDTNFTIVTICTSCALRASDCYTVLTVNAIFTVNNYFIQVS